MGCLCRGYAAAASEKVLDRDYYLTSHAEEEMWADELERFDIEDVLLKGRIEKKRSGVGRSYRSRGLPAGRRTATAYSDGLCS